MTWHAATRRYGFLLAFIIGLLQRTVLVQTEAVVHQWWIEKHEVKSKSRDLGRPLLYFFPRYTICLFLPTDLCIAQLTAEADGGKTGIVRI